MWQETPRPYHDEEDLIQPVVTQILIASSLTKIRLLELAREGISTTSGKKL